MIFHKRHFASISLLEEQMFVHERVFGKIPLLEYERSPMTRICHDYWRGGFAACTSVYKVRNTTRSGDHCHGACGSSLVLVDLYADRNLFLKFLDVADYADLSA